MNQTDRERSFIAQLTADSGTLGFFSELYDLIPLDPNPTFSWTAMAPARLGHMLGRIAEPRTVTPLEVYFRYTENGYKLFVRSARYYRTKLDFKKGFLGVFSTDDDEHRELFSITTLEDMSDQPIQPGSPFSCHLIAASTGQPLGVRTRQLSITVPSSRRPSVFYNYSGITADGASPLTLKLKVLQSNVPYLDEPDEV